MANPEDSRLEVFFQAQRQERPEGRRSFNEIAKNYDNPNEWRLSGLIKRIEKAILLPDAERTQQLLAIESDVFDKLAELTQERGELAQRKQVFDKDQTLYADLFPKEETILPPGDGVMPFEGSIDPQTVLPTGPQTETPPEVVPSNSVPVEFITMELPTPEEQIELIDGQIADYNDLLVNLVHPHISPALEAVHEAYADVPAFGSVLYFEEYDAANEKGKGLLKTFKNREKELHRILTRIEERNNRAPHPDFDTMIHNVEHMIEGLHEAIHEIEHLIAARPTEAQEQVMTLLRELNHGEMPSPNEFLQLINVKINSVAEDVDKGDVGWKGVSFHLGNGSHVSILDLAGFFWDERDHHNPLADLNARPERDANGNYNLNLGDYWKVFPEIFAYGNWRLKSRVQKVHIINNYSSAKSMYETADRDNKALIVDGNMLDIMDGMLKTKLDYEVPAAEMGRAAIILYDNLDTIPLIAQFDISEEKKEEIRAKFPGNPAESDRIIKEARRNVQLHLITEQPDLKWLLRDDLGVANFLLNNLENIIPWEERTKDQFMTVRKVIQLVSAAGVVADKTASDPNLAKYRDLLTKDLKVQVIAGETVYFINGVEITGKEEDPNKEIHKTLSRMQNYGEMMEGGANDLFFATWQFLKVDVIARGYPSEAMAIASPLLQGNRYAKANYQGIDLMIARKFPKLLDTWYGQALIRDPEDTNQSIEKRKKVSFLRLITDPKRTMDTISIKRDMDQGEAFKVGEMMKRAYDLYQEMKSGIFSASEVRLAALAQAEDKDAGVSLRKLIDKILAWRKEIKYVVEYFPIEEPGVVEWLTGNVKLREAIRAMKLPEEKRAAYDIMIDSMLVDMLQYSLMREFVDRYAQGLKSAHDTNLNNDGTLKVDDAIQRFLNIYQGSGKSGELVSDLVVFWNLITEPGQVLRTIDAKHPIGEPLFYATDENEGTNPGQVRKREELTNPNTSYEMARMIRRSIAEAMTYVVQSKLFEDSRITPFEFYVQVPDRIKDWVKHANKFLK